MHDQDVCEKAKGGQSHTAHRVVAFEPYAPAALFLRIAVTALVLPPLYLPACQYSFLSAVHIPVLPPCTACWSSATSIEWFACAWPEMNC